MTARPARGASAIGPARADHAAVFSRGWHAGMAFSGSVFVLGGRRDARTVQACAAPSGAGRPAGAPLTLYTHIRQTLDPWVNELFADDLLTFDDPDDEDGPETRHLLADLLRRAGGRYKN
jgi:hypothetical protein